MRADFEICLGRERTARLAAELLRGAPPALFERLHPERLGDVRDGFGEAVERRGTCVEARGEALPPGIQDRVNGVGRAAADFLADLLNRRALA